jgi:Spy/CpxP family protein refolding chaperone
MLHGLLAHAEELELTEDQQAQIKEIATESRKAMVQLRADSELAGMELQALIRSDDPDLEAIQQGLENVASAQVAERFAAIEATVSARSVLTDEQQAKVKEAVRGQRGPQRGNGPKRGDGPKRGGRPERSGR